MEWIDTLPWMALSIITPLAAAALVFLVGRQVLPVVLLFTVSGVWLSLAGLTAQVWRHGPLHYAIGGWDAPLGIGLYADGLSTLMLWMTAIVGAGISVYACSYFAHSQKNNTDLETTHLFWPL
ncbi:MAG: oxidoreductase, partial [Pseudomonadota bacterium]|nr:oxidoreductase [Pseudomonadota bacterium]